MKKVDLEHDKIGKLLKMFAIPCIISLVVNALYNIVDQIFIGWGVGYLGNGATNVVFPITMICLAFALTFGDGTSAFLSLKLGEKKKTEAANGVGNGILISVIVSLLLCISVIIFLPQLLNLFGCTESLRSLASDYGFIIALGIPFMMIGTTLNSIIRADGSPQYAMFSMVIGAILNIILDPIAIFVFKWGITGAAIATIFSQFVTFLLNVLYLKKMKNIELGKETFHLSLEKVKNVTSLGISSFITQMAIVIVISVQNNLFNLYGTNSIYGSDIPITVLGIVMKINQILNSVIIGIAAGSQPIIGYNYGAGRYDRVKKTLKINLLLSFSVSVIAFILFQTIPETLINLFGSGNELYNEFACLTFRVFLMLTLCNGIQIASSIFFQAIGKSGKSAFLSLSRQILFFIPAAIILSKIYGVKGVLYAGPVADGFAFLITTCLLIIQIKHLKISKKEMVNYENEPTIRAKTNYMITINRKYGSGGRYVGYLLAKSLNLKLYDKDLISLVSDESGYSASYIEEKEEQRTKTLLSNFNSQYYHNLTNDDNLFLAETKAIKKVYQQGPCVIIGRCADYILKEHKNVIRIFLYSDENHQIDRVVKYYGIKKENALKEIQRKNKARERHYNFYTGQKWKDIENYDFAFHVDAFGAEKTADMIKEIILKLEK